MKKIIFTLIALVAAIAAQAQGFVGAGIGVATEKTTDMARYTSFQFTPTAGYTFDEHWAAGLALGISYSDQAEVSVCSVDFGPYARYTFYRNGAFSLFGEAAIYYLHTKVSHLDGIDGFGAALRPGCSFMLGDNWQLLAKSNLLTYRRDCSGVDANTFGFSVNLANVQFCVAYNF